METSQKLPRHHKMTRKKLPPCHALVLGLSLSSNQSLIIAKYDNYSYIH
jgi:hypothetical protein